ncbi:MAG TPA: hypothetical protein VF743_08385, partial [Acidimicrobiales bacterium]
YRPAGGSWTRSLDLGGSLASQPAVVSTGAGRVHVFARGTDDTLQHRSLSAGRWSAWESLGGLALTSAPTVTSSATGRLDVLARGPDNTLRYRSFTATTGWSAWTSIGGRFTSSPSVTTTTGGRLHVFARSTTSSLRHRSFTPGVGWSTWTDLGGTWSSQPAAASAGDGQLDVVVRDAAGALGLVRFTGTGGWAAPVSLGGAFTSGPGAVAVGTAVTAVARGTNGFIRESTRPSATAAWSPWTNVDQFLPFRRLGTWVDVFDYGTLDPGAAVVDMQARGVRTLYLSTARFNGTTDMFDPVEAGRWLDAAHFAGLKVVGWYLPAYGDMARDVRRTVAIARFTSPAGQRFDAVGVDIERLDEVTLAQFNTLLVSHLTLVRAQADAVLTAIVPSPFATDPGNRWAGFPWAAVGRNAEVVLPMALWSFRSNADGSAYSPDQVYLWVYDQVQRARSLTGRRVHVEGGVDDPGTERTPITADRVDRFVDAALDADAIGGSHYDYATTAPALWPTLARLDG